MNHARSPRDPRISDHKRRTIPWLMLGCTVACLWIVEEHWQSALAADPPSLRTSPSHPVRADASPIKGRPHRVGYQRLQFRFTTKSGEEQVRQLDIWYPTEEKEHRHFYTWQVGWTAGNAAVASGAHPLLLFSHGFLGVSDQSIVLTESCARAGYIVASMNHADSLVQPRKQPLEPPRFTDYANWDDAKYRDRREDMTALLDQLLKWNKTDKSPWFGRINENAIGGMGHSLGGYTILGLAGGWPSWKEPRLKAAVLFSPFAHPYTAKGDLEGVSVPVMLQGGTFDFNVTPFLPAVYRQLKAPKSLLVLKYETHYGWTNFANLKRTTTEAVATGNPELMLKYTVAFFDRYLLKSDAASVLDKADSRLESFQFEPR